MASEPGVPIGCARFSPESPLDFAFYSVTLESSTLWSGPDIARSTRISSTLVSKLLRGKTEKQGLTWVGQKSECGNGPVPDSLGGFGKSTSSLGALFFSYI